MKKKLKYRKILIVLILYVFTLTSGYALFSSSLLIGGIVSTAPYYDSDILPIEITLADPTNNRHFIEVNHKNKIDFKEERISEGDYQIVYQKKLWLTLTTGTLTYKVIFKNNTNLPMTKGRVDSLILQQAYNGIRGVNASLSKTMLAPGEECEITMNVDINFENEAVEHVVGFDIYYTLQGRERKHRITIPYVAYNRSIEQ